MKDLDFEFVLHAKTKRFDYQCLKQRPKKDKQIIEEQNVKYIY